MANKYHLSFYFLCLSLCCVVLLYHLSINGYAFIKTTYDISLDSQISLLPLGFSQSRSLIFYIFCIIQHSVSLSCYVSYLFYVMFLFVFLLCFYSCISCCNPLMNELYLSLYYRINVAKLIQLRSHRKA